MSLSIDIQRFSIYKLLLINQVTSANFGLTPLRFIIRIFRQVINAQEKSND